MGQKCACDIMEVTNLNFGEDSEASDSSHSSSNDNNISDSDTASDIESDTNLATEGQDYISDCITDVDGLTNSSCTDPDIDGDDGDDDGTDTAIVSSSLIIEPSTHLSSNNSSSSGMTPIPAPSPLEIIRAVTFKQNEIREEMRRRRHSLPSTNKYLHGIHKSKRFSHHGPSLRDLHAKYKGNSAPNDNNRIGTAPRSQPIDINKVITNQYRIEELYDENNSDYDPEPLYQQFRRHQQQQIVNEQFNHHVLPQNNPTLSTNDSANSQSSIDDELNNIKTITNVLDTGTTFHFTMSDGSISSDEYNTDNTSESISSISETSSDEEYVADDDDDDDDDDDNDEYTKSRPWNKRRYKGHRHNKRKSDSYSPRSIRIIIASDDEDEKQIEEKNQVNKINSVPIKHIQLKKSKSPRTLLAAVRIHNDNVQVPILSPTQTHSGDNSFDFDNVKFSDNDDIDDEILPLTSITPTNTFDGTVENKNNINNDNDNDNKQFSKNLTKELLTLVSNESVPSDRIIQSGTDQDVIPTNNISNLSPNSYSAASDITSHSNISNSSQCSNSSLSINIKQGIAGMSIHSISNSKSNSNSNELI